ncbi:MAG: tetratricopeptide repeat protein, partial [Candidatus Obscuribacterales bacterium]|nr:tetratricopeptide repeat protein [Candidatus Obscuribacterales bacterium]
FFLLSNVLSLQAVLAWEYAGPVNQLLDEASKLYDQGKYASAKMQFNEALRLEPNCPDAYNGLGLCSLKEGKIQESNACYTSAIKLKPDFYNSLYNLANNLYLEGNYPASISYFRRALSVRESSGRGADPDILTSLANVYREQAATLSGLKRQEDFKLALKFYNLAIKMNPSHPQAHAELGALYANEHEYSAAENELRKAIALRPGYAYAYFKLACIFEQKKEFPAALVAFHSSLKCETLESYRAETARKIALLGIPEELVDHFAEGYEQLNGGNFAQAQSEFQAAASIDSPLKAIAINNLAFCRARSGDLAMAMNDYAQALKICPHGFPEPYYNLGQVLLQSKRLTEAEQNFRTCLLESRGNHYLAHNALGVLLKQKGDLKGALDQYNLALLQSSGALSVVQFNRGLLLEKLGRKQEALESYRKYLQASPSGLNAGAAKERLLQLSRQGSS